ncbi:MAG: TonB-dependent receptor [Candidatus Nitrohelix vancouverensis]|uniref:TonB-dependent receptor n=1 Tax=Candidatus Nitrohelix vancouverensis TaxID=2705534 RepID=A0A7T0G4G5_9BACT|nr:MAG: TonB-dependent receptor [Candidatus Nitrohelix vancouverensis]
MSFWLGASFSESAYADEGDGKSLHSAFQDSKQASYNIIAGPLASALNQFADQNGLTLAYDSSLVEGLRTQGISGKFTKDEVLSQLLQGSGLDFEITGNHILKLKKLNGQGAELRLDGVSVTARRVKTSISSIPESITIIDQDQIEQQARLSSDINDLLGKTVPGVTLDPESNFDLVQIRGRSALVLIDGVPQNTLLRDVGINLQTVDINAVERIEVVRGASATYGFGAQGGIINIITKRASSEEPVFTSRVGLGFSAAHVDSSLSKKLYQDVSGTDGKLDYLFNFGFEDRDGAYDATGKRTLNFGYENKYFNLGGSLGYQLTDDQSTRLNFNYFRQDPDKAITAANGVFGFKRADAKILDSSGLALPVDEAYRHNININAQYSHQNIGGNQFNMTYFFQEFEDRRAQNGLGTTDSRLGARFNVISPLSVVSGLTMNWGVDLLRYEDVEKCYGSGIGDFCSSTGLVLVPETTQDSVAVYGQWDLPVENFNFSFGVRHEEFFVGIESVSLADRTDYPGKAFHGGDITYNSTLFNAGVVYHIDDQMNVFAGFSQGFDVSQVGRATFNATSAGSLDPQPATTDQYEMGLRSSHGWGRFEASMFYSDSELAASLTQVATNQPFINTRQPQKIWGVELVIDSNPIGNWTFGGVGTYQDGEVSKVSGSDPLGSEYIAVPRGTAYAQYTPYPWWTNRFQVLYSSQRKPFSDSDTTYGNGNVDDFFTADFSAGFTTPYGQVDLGVENMFNALYYAPSQAQARNSNSSYYAAQGTTVSMTYTTKW